jgi:hypothetical protein
MKFFYTTIALLLWCNLSFAQHQEITAKPDMWKGKQENILDTSSLLYAFKSGRVNGHFRYFFMATDNAKTLTDFYANAVGGGIRYETAKFKGFQFAVSGFYIFNIGSSDLTKKDPQSGQTSRYETPLFDVADPANTNDLDRLEEFYLKYNYKKSSITFGRQLINTPFINLQDGRMRPTGVDGVWLVLNDIPKTKIEGGLLNAISPRGTVKWYGVGESIGVYPAGLNTDGTKSGYPGHVEANNLIQAAIHFEPVKNTTLHAWNLLVPNVFNTTLLQLDYTIPTNEKEHQFYTALQLVKQHALKNGGNADPAKRYIDKDNGAFSFGAKAGFKTAVWDLSLNYNRITKQGRYLMPREWGRDPFFTFLPRERNEGFGDVSAIVAKAGYTIPQKRIKLNLAGGYFKLPDVNNTTLNKYGLPSYIQINADIRYAFVGFFQGLDAQLLIVGKMNQGELYQQAKYEINKVNMVLYNFVLNYHF